tara:strand:+ start:1535 stop:2464 length:930 start_codon:yes stop_codon:yes gene_type:complete
MFDNLKPILKTPSVVDELNGKFFYKKSAKNLSWFKVGGVLEYLYIPKNEADLSILLNELIPNIEINVFGKLSNILIRDGGLSGLSILIPADFKKLIHKEENILNVGSGALDKQVAKKSIDLQIGGFEFLSGIPGTIGGGIFMNAGCYGSEFKDIVLDVNFLNRNGKKIKKKAEEIDFKYRESNIPKDLIITSVNLIGFKKNKEEIKRKISEISKKRISTQPQGYPTGGSTFKNDKQYKAWELISKVEISKLRCGGAMISDRHNNFMINTGKAKASDFENLGEMIIDKVQNQFGIKLEWEIQILGKNGKN